VQPRMLSRANTRQPDVRSGNEGDNSRQSSSFHQGDPCLLSCASVSLLPFVLPCCNSQRDLRGVRFEQNQSAVTASMRAQKRSFPQRGRRVKIERQAVALATSDIETYTGGRKLCLFHSPTSVAQSSGCLPSISKILGWILVLCGRFAFFCLPDPIEQSNEPGDQKKTEDFRKRRFLSSRLLTHSGLFTNRKASQRQPFLPQAGARLGASRV
jgi:hypothetical protein